MEDYNYVFNGPVQAALASVRSGEYGDLVHVDVAVSLGILAEGSSYLDEVSGRSFRDMPGGADRRLPAAPGVLAHAFIGRHRRVESVWTKALPTHPFASDEMRALVEGASATASIGFSSRAKPDLFSLTVEGTSKRSRINVFEGRAVHERQLQTAGPLIPLVNGLREGRDSGVGSLKALAGKLSGGPGAYGGLWTLVTRVYDALRGGGAAPGVDGPDARGDRPRAGADRWRGGRTMRVLVTGANGFLGRHVVVALSQAGHGVVAV